MLLIFGYDRSVIGHTFQVSDGESKLGEKKKRSLFGTSDVPININFPNKRGMVGYDSELPIEEIVKDIPRIVKDQAKVRTCCKLNFLLSYSFSPVFFFKLQPVLLIFCALVVSIDIILYLSLLPCFYQSGSALNTGNSNSFGCSHLHSSASVPKKIHTNCRNCQI